MSAVQLDLFNDLHADLVTTVAAPALNGFYYERSTDRFVSFVLGRRHYEESAKRCGHPKDWQERIRKERAI